MLALAIEGIAVIASANEPPLSSSFDWEKAPFDANGRPTSDESFFVLRYFFENRTKKVSPSEVGKLLCIPHDRVLGLCHQYLAAAILKIDSADPYLFLYDLQSSNEELQAKFESSLLTYWQSSLAPRNPDDFRTR